MSEILMAAKGRNGELELYARAIRPPDPTRGREGT
jgi:hypothetical protein